VLNLEPYAIDRLCPWYTQMDTPLVDYFGGRRRVTYPKCYFSVYPERLRAAIMLAQTRSGFAVYYTFITGLAKLTGAVLQLQGVRLPERAGHQFHT
jgi:hypothetical protein